MEKRIEQSRIQKNSQLKSERKLLSDTQSSCNSKMVPGDTNLSHALSITQKKFNLTRIEEDQLVSGIE